MVAFWEEKVSLTHITNWILSAYVVYELSSKNIANFVFIMKVFIYKGAAIAWKDKNC